MNPFDLPGIFFGKDLLPGPDFTQGGIPEE